MPASSPTVRRRRAWRRSELAEGLLLIALCVGLLLIPVAFYRREQSFLACAVKARGTVVKVICVPASHRTFNYIPDLQFVDQSGRAWVVHRRAPCRASCVAGQELTVLYDPLDPSLAQPDDPAANAANWHFAAALAAAGLPLLPVGLYKLGAAASELVRRRRAAATRADP